MILFRAFAIRLIRYQRDKVDGLWYTCGCHIYIYRHGNFRHLPGVLQDVVVSFQIFLLFATGLVAEAYQRTLSVIEPERHELRHISKLDETDCKSVSWCANKLIIGTHSQILTGDPSIGSKRGERFKTEKCDTTHHLHCVRSLGPHTVVVCCRPDYSVSERHLRISNTEHIKNSRTLCYLIPLYETSTYISATDQHIAVTNPELYRNITVYNIHGMEQLFTLGSGQLTYPWGVALHDDFVLVTDHKADCLYKYPLREESAPDWVCHNLKSPTGVCADKKCGFIKPTGVRQKQGILHVGLGQAEIIDILDFSYR